MLHLLFLFFALLLVGGIFCIGFFESSRGNTETAPNGKEIDTYAMILYPLNKWLTKTKRVIFFYEGDSLISFYEKIKNETPQLNHVFEKTHISRYGKCLDANKDVIEHWKDFLSVVNQKYGVESLMDDDGVIKFWKIYNESIYPDIISKPIVGCYKCYSSFWGSIIYWLGVSMAIRTEFITKDFSILIPMWIVFCVSLVTVNCYIKKKLDNG